MDARERKQCFGRIFPRNVFQYTYKFLTVEAAQVTKSNIFTIAE